MQKVIAYMAAMGIAGSVALPAFALPPVHPVLPPVTYIDTEAATNVPFTAWQEANSASEPIGVFAEDVRQITTISADGDFSVMKLGHTATRQINGTITLDGNADDGILDN